MEDLKKSVNSWQRGPPVNWLREWASSMACCVFLPKLGLRVALLDYASDAQLHRPRPPLLLCVLPLLFFRRLDLGFGLANDWAGACTQLAAAFACIYAAKLHIPSNILEDRRRFTALLLLVTHGVAFFFGTTFYPGDRESVST